jgi:hypothetical protein
MKRAAGKICKACKRNEPVVNGRAVCKFCLDDFKYLSGIQLPPVRAEKPK